MCSVPLLKTAWATYSAIHIILRTQQCTYTTLLLVKLVSSCCVWTAVPRGCSGSVTASHALLLVVQHTSGAPAPGTPSPVVFLACRVYNFSNSLSVYDRLTADAAVRQNLKSMRVPPAAGLKSADVDLKLATAPPTRASGRTSNSSGAAGQHSGYVC